MPTVSFRSIFFFLCICLGFLNLTAQPSLAQEASGSKTALQEINGVIGGALFFDISGGRFQVDEVDRKGNKITNPDGTVKQKTVSIPFLIAFLASGAIFFTFYYGWINIRAFKHSLDIIRGKHDKEDDEGEISHFRALTSALSATVGLGNIAGVAVAIETGGPGAVFWMIAMALFSMTAKFNSCTLAQMYRKVNADGSISGGPMYYLDIGLRQYGTKGLVLGKILAVLYAILLMGGCLGGGNMFQSNQATAALRVSFGLDKSASLWIGIVIALFVGVVILGGIKRIGAATSRIVPAMCGIYVITALYIVLSHFSELPSAIGLILTLAFSKNAFFGGMLGVLVTGVKRAAFSNEGGLGSASIAHAAAKTDEPVREGIVAMIGPVIDTVIVCSMTALVVVITGVYENTALIEGASKAGALKGVLLTSAAFGTVLPWFPYVLTICIALFAYSTMISWCYYGERGWIYLNEQLGFDGLKNLFIFRIIFLVFVVFGAINSLSDVIDFSDLMLLSMAFPNILGSLFLVGKVKERLNDYWSRYQAGAFD